MLINLHVFEGPNKLLHCLIEEDRTARLGPDCVSGPTWEPGWTMHPGRCDHADYLSAWNIVSDEDRAILDTVWACCEHAVFLHGLWAGIENVHCVLCDAPPHKQEATLSLAGYLRDRGQHVHVAENTDFQSTPIRWDLHPPFDYEIYAKKHGLI